MNQWRKKLRKKAAKGIAAAAGLMAFLILGTSAQARGEVYREPVLSGTIETSVYVGEEFDQNALVNRVLADDLEDGDLTYQIKEIFNNVDTQKVGEYTVGYEIMDSDGNVTALNTRVNVIEDDGTAEKTVKRQLYTIGDASHLTDIGFNRGYYHDRQSLGFLLKQDGELQIRLVNGTEFGSDLNVTFMNQDGWTQTEQNIPRSGEWVTLKNVFDAKDKDGNYITDEAGNRVKSSRESVPFIRTPKNTAVQPIVEFKWTDDMEQISYYRYKDDEAAFFADWHENDLSYAIIEGSAATFLVPIIDRDNIINHNNDRYSFGTIDEMLEWYADFVAYYDAMVGLDFYAKEQYDQNVRAKFFIYANEHGAGLAYYSGDHSAFNGNQLSDYLIKSWLSLHEFGHGYEGAIANREYSFVETTNNILAYHFQQTFLKEGDFGWLLDFSGKTREERWANMERTLLARRENYTTLNQITAGAKEYRITLYMFINLLEKIGPEKGLGSMHSKYREIFAKTGQHPSSGDVIIEGMSDVSKFNLVPYYGTFYLWSSSDVENETYDKDYVIPYYLKDILTDDADAQAVKEKYGLSGVYSLVTTDELAYTGYTSNMTINLDIDNIEQIKNKILLIKNGSQVVKALVIDDTELSVELPVGVYEVELPAPDDKSYLYGNEYMVASKGAAEATFSYKHETGNPLADDMQIKLLGLGDGEFANIKVDTYKDTTGSEDVFKSNLTVELVAAEPHSGFGNSDYASIRILSPEDEEVYYHVMKGAGKPEKNQVLEFEGNLGTKIEVYHAEGRSRLRTVSAYTTETLSDYAATEQSATLIYVLTDKGWMLEGWDEAKQNKVYYNTLTAYSDYLLSHMSSTDLQDKTSYYNEKILLELASKYLTEEQLQKYEEKYGVLIGKTPAYQTAYEKIDSGTLTGYADTDHSEGRGNCALDGKTNTYWHSNYSPNTTNMEEGSEKDNGYTILLSKNTDIGKLEYLPRQDATNGRILAFEIYYSETVDGDDFQQVQLENSEWANDYSLKYVEFDAPNARRIRIEARASEGSQKNKFVTAAEFYLYEKYKNYANARDIYLSNLHRDYQEEEVNVPQMDKDATGNDITLKVDGTEKTFEKGIGLSGNATIVYDFTNRKFDSFTTYVGVETRQNAEATASVSFYGDDKLIYTTGNLSSVTNAEQITIDMAGIKKLKMVVTGADEGTRISLADAKLYLAENSTDVMMQVGEVVRIQENMSLTSEAERWISWTSGDETVVTVDANGNITAVAAGTTTITATGTNKELTAVITVVEPEVMKVVFNSQEMFISKGQTEELGVALYPEFAVNSVINWTSSDASIISVDANGTITANAEGTATITATTENGITAAFTRTVVEGEAVNPEIPSGHTHEYGKWTVTQPVTCIVDGYQERVCTCGKKEVYILKAEGHILSDWAVTKEVTCAEDGEEGRNCSKCDYTETKVIEKLTTHTYGEWVTIKEATCGEVGERRRTCTVCQEVQSKEIPKRIVHTYGEWEITKETSCAAPGELARTCSVCSGVETREIPQLTEHTFGEWTVTKEATLTSKGELSRRCTAGVCTYTETRVIVAKAEKPADGITQNQPFNAGTGGSNHFRIPCLVSMADGTIVAVADARWTWAADAGGIDTLVSRSKNNGTTWQYTFANYLGDNGNTANKTSSCFIDPAIATDGKTIYMIADLFPAGYALNSAQNTPTAGDVGFDANGNLRLSADGRSTYGYYLEKIEDATTTAYYEIKDLDGNVVEGYVIDAYFNIKGEHVDTNLFLEDSPYEVYPTAYLYLTTSKDGGATWSIPSFINVKKANEKTVLVGPGTGIVTSTGRIVFTAYKHNSGYDEKTTTLYSDDKGLTWKRGETLATQSSEATITEADGKLYMFTRHGGYYVSEDWGETWSDRVETGITYNTGTQLNCITYSKKVDGKTAIILSAPASTSGRQNGKLFVALVQEDGSLKWEYEYEVTGASTYYAYSSLTELADGNIGLLYEHQGSAIKYVNIPITDIVGIWLEDENGVEVTEVALKAGEEATITLGGTPDNALEISSDNDAVTAIWNEEEGTITFSADEAATGLVEAVVTISDGSGSVIVVKVTVTGDAVGAYEVVDLMVGDTAVFKDTTGNYGNTDVSGTADIVQITLTGVGLDETRAQLAVGDGDFAGEYITMSSSAYTFDNVSKSGTSTFTCTPTAMTANGTTVYLNNTGTATIPNLTSPTTITFAMQNDGTFTIRASSYLYFHYNESGKLYFNRNSGLAGVNTAFDLYMASENAPADSPISGYVKVTSLDDIVEDGKYLIAHEGIVNGVSIGQYVLYPYSGGSAFNHVAKATGEGEGTAITDIVINAVAKGSASIKIGDITYFINVRDKEQNMTVEQNQRFFIKTENIPQMGEQSVVIRDAEAALVAPYTAVTTITDGKYLLGIGTQVITNDVMSGSPTGLTLKNGNVTKDDLSEYLWTITAVDGGYTLQDVKGQYVNISGTSVTLSETATTIRFGTRENGTFSIGNGSNYFNKWGGSSSTKVAAYSDINDANSKWYVYKPSTGYWFTAAEVGTTSIVVDDVIYNIEVIGCQHSDVALEDVTEPTCFKEGYTGDIKCTVCGDVLVAGTAISTTDHVYSEWEVTTEPNCTEEGTKTRTCTVEECGATEEKAVDPIGEAGHVWDEGVVTKEPTTTEEGEKTYTCTICDTTKTEPIPTIDEESCEHRFGDWEVIVEPGCEESGQKKRICSRCKKAEVEEVAATGHTESTELVGKKEATCTEAGYTGDKVCVTCEEVIEKGTSIEASGHTEVTDAGKEAGCEEDGLTAGSHCSVCDKVLTAQTVIPATGHSMGEWTEVKAATCEEAGELSRGCSACDKEETKEIEALGHDYKQEVTAPTCTEEGYTIYTCSRCNESYRSDVTPATGHSYQTNWSSNATSHYHVCEICDDIKDIAEHTFTWKIDKEATTTETGLKHEECTTCEYKRNENTVIEKLEEEHTHNFGTEWNFDGEKHWKECVCGEKAEEANHTVVTDAGKEAGCEEEGLTAGSHCSVCDKVLTAQTVIPATGHSMGEWTEVKAAGCEEAGESIRECSACDKEETKEIAALGHAYAENFTVDKAATCEEAGSKSRHCTRTDCKERTEETVIPATGHSMGEWTEVKAATCEEAGELIRECSACDKEETKEIAATGHSYQTNWSSNATSHYHVCEICDDVKDTAEHTFTWKIDKEATTTETGLKHEECTTCEYKRNENTVIEKLEEEHTHNFGTEWNFDGEKHWKECVCGEKAEEANHTVVTDAGKEATCEEDGLTAGSHCSVCDKVLTAQTVIPATGHSMGEWTEVKAATCEEAGEAIRECSACDKEETKAIAALGHAYAKDFTVDKAATCEEAGSKSRHCTRTGCKERTEETVITATGHSMGEWTEVKEATCEEAGEAIRECSACDKEETKTIPATGHSMGEWTEVKAATCEEAGEAIRECRACDKKETKEIEATGHSYQTNWSSDATSHYHACENCDDVKDTAEHTFTWKIDKEATTTETGLKHEECTTCEYKRNENTVIEKLEEEHTHNFGTEWNFDGEKHWKECVCGEKAEEANHTVVTDAGKEATCEEEGLTAGSHCSVCDKVLTAQTVIPATGHSMGEWTEVKAATCEEAGEAIRECSACDKEETKAIAALGHAYAKDFTVDKAATCEEAGSKSRHCTRTGCEERTEETVIEATGHSYQTNWSSDATSHYHVCENCDDVKDTAEHTFTWKIDQKATTTEDGLMYEECTVCGKVENTTIIAYPKEVKLSRTSYTYTGKTKTPKVTVTDSKGKRIASSNYTVSYSKNKEIGTAKVTIKFKGNYKGTITKTFTIKPKTVSLSKVTAKSKGFTAKWKKASQISGYQIQYSTSKNFTKAKSVTLSKSKVSYSKSKLSGNKTYYVRIRTYKTVSGKKYYSEWSSVKKVKTKR